MTTEELFLTLLDKARTMRDVRTIGVGVAKDVTDQHCTIIQDGAPDIYEARFHAITDQLESSITIYPKDGSYVLYALIEDSQTEAVIISCSEIEKTVVKIGTTTHEISPDGHSIKKGADSVRELLTDLITEIQKIIVINGRSPNVPALEQLKQKFQNIFF
jgi:hypothetical protein